MVISYILNGGQHGTFVATAALQTRLATRPAVGNAETMALGHRASSFGSKVAVNSRIPGAEKIEEPASLVCELM
jgi:hypothetical protein